MSDDIDRQLEELERRSSSSSCSISCDCCSEDILRITSCLKELKDIAKCVFKCLDCHPSAFEIQKVGICVVLNEIQAIEAKLDNDVFGLKEIKNEIRFIENEVIAINNTVNNGTSGIFEIKNEIRSIENEVSVIGNNILALSRSLSCDNDSVQICGLGIEGVTGTIRTDVNNILATVPSASTQSQIGRLFSTTLIDQLLSLEIPTLSLVITNPPSSGRIMYLDSVFGGSTFFPANPANQNLSYQSALQINIHRDALPGVDQFERNLNFGFPDNSAMSASVVNGSSGPVVASTVVVFGHFSLDSAGKIIIPPDHSVGISVNTLNVGNNVINVSLTVTWYELDEPA